MSVFKFDQTTATVAQLHDLAALTAKYLLKNTKQTFVSINS